jgi:hypothetical protein
MSRTPARVTQADISRALRAAQAVGANVTVEVAPDGTIRLVPHDKPQAELAPRKKIVL